MRLEHEKYRIR